MPEIHNQSPEVFIIAAMTTDGFIAKDENHAASWTSKADKAHFVELTKDAGVIVMGSKTFNTLPRPLKERLNVVFTRNPDQYKEKYPELPDNLMFIDGSAEDAIDRIKEKGFGKIAVCGGSSVYSLFMKSGLVTKMHLTIEPIIFGKGMSLFNESIDGKFALLDSKTTEEGTVFLTYETIQQG